MVVRTLALLITLSTLLYPALRYLQRTTVAQTNFESVSQVWNNPADDDSRLVDMGFYFPFNNNGYRYIYINTNGALTFNYSSSDFDYNPQALPYKNRSIFPYWFDFNPEEGGTIRYGTLGSGDDQRFIVTWENLPRYFDAGRYSIQAILYADGSIRFRYDATSDAWSEVNAPGCGYWWTCMGASIGVQESRTYYDQYSFNAPIDPTLDVLYSPIQNISVNKSSCVLSDPINNTNNPKRIPGATIRYAIEVTNRNAPVNNVIVEDNLDNSFDYSSINYLQIQSGLCDCLGVTSANNNGSNGSTPSQNPIRLDFGTIARGRTNSPSVECGYFEVNIQ